MMDRSIATCVLITAGNFALCFLALLYYYIVLIIIVILFKIIWNFFQSTISGDCLCNIATVFTLLYRVFVVSFIAVDNKCRFFVPSSFCYCCCFV